MRPLSQHYSVILADPPWTFATYSRKGKGRSAEAHYDCMSLAAIKSLPVGDWAAPDCALFLWATDPSLPQALEVIEAWGFAYKTVAFTPGPRRRRTVRAFRSGAAIGPEPTPSNAFWLLGAARNAFRVLCRNSSSHRAASTAASPMSPMSGSRRWCLALIWSCSRGRRGQAGTLGATRSQLALRTDAGRATATRQRSSRNSNNLNRRHSHELLHCESHSAAHRGVDYLRAQRTDGAEGSECIGECRLNELDRDFWADNEPITDDEGRPMGEVQIELPNEGIISLVPGAVEITGRQEAQQ
jgi:MT-A70